MRLCSVFAIRNSARHHLDSVQAGETRKRTTSQRSAAALRASCQRSPATRIDIQEDVVEALLGQPVAQRERGPVVGARTADEQPCHDQKAPRCLTARIDRYPRWSKPSGRRAVALRPQLGSGQ
jgi:hypothetical protein